MGLRVRTNRVAKNTGALAGYRTLSAAEPTDIAASTRSRAKDTVELSEGARQKLKELAVSTESRAVVSETGERGGASLDELVTKLESLKKRAETTFELREGEDKHAEILRARSRLSSQILDEEVAFENQAAARVRLEDLAVAEGAVKRVLEKIKTEGPRAVDAQAKRLSPGKTRLPQD